MNRFYRIWINHNSELKVSAERLFCVEGIGAIIMKLNLVFIFLL